MKNLNFSIFLLLVLGFLLCMSQNSSGNKRLVIVDSSKEIILLDLSKKNGEETLIRWVRIKRSKPKKIKNLDAYLEILFEIDMIKINLEDTGYLSKLLDEAMSIKGSDEEPKSLKPDFQEHKNLTIIAGNKKIHSRNDEFIRELGTFLDKKENKEKK